VSLLIGRSTRTTNPRFSKSARCSWKSRAGGTADGPAWGAVFQRNRHGKFGLLKAAIITFAGRREGVFPNRILQGSETLNQNAPIGPRRNAFCASHGDEFKHFLIPFQHASRYRRKRGHSRFSKVGTTKSEVSRMKLSILSMPCRLRFSHFANAAEAAPAQSFCLISAARSGRS